jgi:hypothetical protein
MALLGHFSSHTLPAFFFKFENKFPIFTQDYANSIGTKWRNSWLSTGPLNWLNRPILGCDLLLKKILSSNEHQVDERRRCPFWWAAADCPAERKHETTQADGARANDRIQGAAFDLFLSLASALHLNRRSSTARSIH